MSYRYLRRVQMRIGNDKKILIRIRNDLKIRIRIKEIQFTSDPNLGCQINTDHRGSKSESKNWVEGYR